MVVIIIRESERVIGLKGAVLIEPNKLEIRGNLDIPEPKIGEVLIKVKACGVCPTDVKKYTGVSPLPKFPFILGHEASGVIKEIGENVGEDAFKIGDRVIVANIITCGYCKNCKDGSLEYVGVGACKNHKVFGVSTDGGFVEYFTMPVNLVYKIPNNLSFHEATLVEPVACCLNGVEKAEIGMQDTVLIIGAGFMGLTCIELARLKGARVIVSDVIDERLEIAKSLGADATVNPKDKDLNEAILDFNDGEYVDAVICSVGGKIPISQGVRSMAAGGRLVLLGGTYPPTTVEIDPNSIHYDQTKIIGSVSYTNRSFTTSIKLIANKKISTKILQSELIDIKHLEKAFHDVLNAKGLRKCVLFD